MPNIKRKIKRQIKSRKNLSIIVPCYNEEKRIGGRLEDLSDEFEAARKNGALNYEIIVVINKSTDKTEEIVRSFRKKNKRISYIHLPEKGKGLAVREGFKIALQRGADYIGFVDADLSTTGEEYLRLFNSIGNYDGIIASRYAKGATVFPKPTFKRFLASRAFNYFVRMLFFFPYKDSQCGGKIFKRTVVDKIIPHLINTQWAFDVDMLFNIQKFGFKIKEEPTTWSDSDYSKINFLHAAPFMALSMIRLRILNSPFKPLMDFYDWLPPWIKIHNRFR